MSKLVDDSLAGEEVIVARNARPLVRLTPVTAIKPVRTPGIWAGKVMIAEHFDELPVDLQEMFGMIDSKPS